MKLLAIHPCEKDIRRWEGGDFIAMDTIAVWSKVVRFSVAIQLLLLDYEVLYVNVTV